MADLDKKISELTAILNSDLAGADLIEVVDSSVGVNKSLLVSELDLRYFAAGLLKLSDGTLSNPGLQFTSDPDTGIHRSAANTLDLIAGAFMGLQLTKADGDFSNVGMGVSASTADSTPLTVERNIAAGLTALFNCPNATATSFSQINLKASTGGVSQGFMSLYNQGYVFVDAYTKGRLVIRQTGSTFTDSGISLVAQDTGTSVRIYSGGTNADKRMLECHADGSTQIRGIRTALSTKTTTYTLNATDHTIIADATGGAFTLTLPAAANSTGQIFVIKKIDATANVTIDGNAAETIDGAATKVLTTQYESVQIQCDGTTWHVIG